MRGFAGGKVIDYLPYKKERKATRLCPICYLNCLCDYNV